MRGKNQRKKVVYLIGEKSVLAFLTVERRSIMNHFRMNFDLMNELHMVSQLLQIPDVAITDLTNLNAILASLWSTRFEATWFHTGTSTPTSATGNRSNGYTGII